MKTLENESLSKHTTVRLGGTAREFIIPESTEELIEIIKEREPKYFIGGGSNLLIAEKEFDLVVSLTEFDTSIEQVSPGCFRAGASLRLQTLINTVNEAGYGGIEYLFSVPGLVGGAVVMNAGRGRQFNQTIADYLISADVVRNGEVVTVPKEECGFSHRDSVFKQNGDLIISALFQFPEVSVEDSQAAKQQRLEYCKEKQDASKPNFGSVFSEQDPKVMAFVKKFARGRGKVHFSAKTSNWIVNEGGTYEEAVKAIKKAESLHKTAGKKCRREVIIWE